MNALSVHARDNDDRHAVALGAIRVILCEDDSEWFAQGIEIDYAASGRTLEDVQQRFEQGLEATIHEHLKRFGTIDGILKYAPEAWRKELTPSREFHFDMVTAVDLRFGMDVLPFDRIVFLQRPRKGYEASSQG